MRRICLYDVYKDFSDYYIKYNNLKDLETLISEKEFNIALEKNYFVLRKLTGPVIERRDEKSTIVELQEKLKVEDQSEDQSESETEDTEVVGGAAKPTSVEIVIAYTKFELFQKKEIYNRLVRALKYKSSSQKELVIIYEKKSKINLIKNVIRALTPAYYGVCIDMSSFVCGLQHMYLPRNLSIVPFHQEEKELWQFMIHKKNLSEVSWLDQSVILLRARIGDVISVNSNSQGSGLHHNFHIVQYN